MPAPRQEVKHNERSEKDVIFTTLVRFGNSMAVKGSADVRFPPFQRKTSMRYYLPPELRTQYLAQRHGLLCFRCIFGEIF